MYFVVCSSFIQINSEVDDILLPNRQRRSNCSHTAQDFSNLNGLPLTSAPPTQRKEPAAVGESKEKVGIERAVSKQGICENISFDY
jgi:hypothetical protein